MQLRYDDDFIEAAVFLGATGRCQGVPAMQIARFHREREKLYHILDPDERNTAFFKLHLDWFREWGLEAPLKETLDEFPLVRKGLAVLAVRKASGKNDEGAELYVNDAGQRTGILALRLERLTSGASLRDYLRHEFMHLHDMLDPAFGYAPELDLPGLHSAQRRLARERYRLLWDITIDGRLAASDHAPIQTHEQHALAFARGYSFWDQEKRDDTFAALWRNPAPTHFLFLELIADPRGLRGSYQPAPGVSCPLCGFPTFVWAETSKLPQAIADRIAAEFPGWSLDHGLCGHCQETYEAASIFARTAPRYLQAQAGV